MLAEAGIARVKLYFMIGLPTETAADVAAIVELSRAVLDRLRAGSSGRSRPRVDLSVNPLVPKPHTPFQYHRMASAADLDAAAKAIRAGVAKVGGLSASFESARIARRQALFALGDRRLGAVLARMAERGESLKKALRAEGVDESAIVDRERTAGEAFVWDVVDTGVRPGFLHAEYRRGLAGKPARRCEPGTCRRCGACGPP